MTLASRMTARSFGLGPGITDKVRVERDVPVAMRDGTVLLGDRWYCPEAPHQPLVLMRSPYGRSMGFGMTARLFAERGFQVFLQSCRGTSGSGGAFNPVRQEPEDGLDTLAWIEAQPWRPSRIFTYGLSYLGFVQWAIAREAGDRLSGMALQCTLSNYRNEVLAFGGLALEGAFGWGSIMSKLTSARSTMELILSLQKRVDPKLYNHLPLAELDQRAVGREIPWWRDWLSHPDPADPWWGKIDFSKTLPEVKAPAAMVGGWQDLFLPWQVKDFELMQAQGRDVWLTIGPWHHTARGGAGETLQQGMALFSAIAKGERPFQDRDRVRLYVMGADQWRDYSAWPPPGAREAFFHLHPDATLAIQPAAVGSDPSRYVFDPADPTPSLHPPSPFAAPAKRPSMAALEARADRLVFTAAPLEADADVIGPVSADLYLRSDRQHTDVYVALCDVDHRGHSTKVCDGYLRLRPGDPPGDEAGVRKVVVSCWPTAYRFRQGHSLRLVVASGAHPRYARNPGTGEPLGTATRMVSQHQEVFHDARYRSGLRVLLA